MAIEIIKSEERGHADHGWLKTYHSFSFASWYNPDKIHFKSLRVLNDDTVAPAAGFGRHPHENMEIVSIPLSGSLRHQDSMGNEHVIKQGDVQVMSAGTGIMHSEVNNSPTEQVKFLQIWIIPSKKNVEPRYAQKHFTHNEMENRWLTMISPSADDGMWLHQQCWISRGRFERGKEISYNRRQENTGIYLFVLRGELQFNGEEVGPRDALAITDEDLPATKVKSDADLLVIETV